MVSLRRMRTLPSALAILMLASSIQARSINFEFYPETAQNCMYEAADYSNCETGVVNTTNECLCQNGGGFIENTASCLGSDSRGDLQKVYDTMSGACGDSSTPISISERQFMEFADGKTTTSTTSTSATTSSSTTSITTSIESPSESSEPEDEGSQGLLTGALAGIIAGSVVGVIVLAGVAFFLLQKKRKQGEESHPMLPDPYTQPPAGHTSVTPSAGGMSASVSPPDTGVYNRVSGYNWESPDHLSLPPDTQAQAQSQNRYTAFQPLHELDVPVSHPAAGREAPVEMNGTPAQSLGPRWSRQT